MTAKFYHRNTQRRCNRLHPRSRYHHYLAKCSLWNAISQVCHWPHALVPQAQHFQSPPSEPYCALRISEYKCMPWKCSETVQSSHINNTFRRSNTAKNHGEAGKSPREKDFNSVVLSQKQAKRCFRWLPCQARLLKSESLVALSWEMPLLASTHNCIEHGTGQMQKGDWFRISRLSEIFGRYSMSRWLYVILWHLYPLGTYHSWFVAWHNLAYVYLALALLGGKNEKGGINTNFK